MYLIPCHVEKLFFAFIASVCVAFALHERADTEAPWQKELDEYRRVINVALAKGPLPNYQYSAKAAGQLACFVMKPHRSAQPAEPLPDVPAFVAYPQPERPWVAPKPVPPTIREVFASLGAVTGVKAHAEPSGITLEFTPPRHPQYMELVRVEIFRSETEDASCGAPYASVQFAVEASPENMAPVPAPSRRHHTEAIAAKPPVPPASTSRFVDAHIQPYKTYYYQCRAVGRMTTPLNTRLNNGDPLMVAVPPLPERGPGGVEAVPTVLRPPTDAQPLASNQPDTLYVSGLTPSLAVTTASNCELRLAGVTGNFPAPNAPAHRVSTDYKANFAVRVWLAEPQLWRETTMQIAVNERIKGKVLYPDAATKKLAAFEFDAGYELAELKWGEISTGGLTKVPQVGPNGKPVVDAAGHILFDTVKVLGASIPNEVAVLKNTRTGTMEEFPKRSAALARKD